jgi:hypothetical protein
MKKITMKKIAILACFTVLCSASVKSQTIEKPNYGLKSHETLEITRIENTQSHSTIYFTVENKITGGYFCADKNIFIVYPDGTRSKLISSKGIPVCPDSYKFKTVGEKLSFELTFPALKQNTKWIDLVEDCQDNCFSFYGLCLNNILNKKIDEASSLAENNEPSKALLSFTDLAGSAENRNSGMEGLVYVSIIKLAKETGDIAKASDWYSKLKSSNIPRKDLYLKNLNGQGILY